MIKIPESFEERRKKLLRKKHDPKHLKFPQQKRKYPKKIEIQCKRTLERQKLIRKM